MELTSASDTPTKSAARATAPQRSVVNGATAVAVLIKPADRLTARKETDEVA